MTNKTSKDSRPGGDTQPSSELSIRALLMIGTAKVGGIAELEEYCSLNQHNQAFDRDKRAVVAAMVQSPEEYPQKKRTFRVLTDPHFDYQSLFAEHPTMTIGALCGMYKANPIPETLEIATTLASEHLRLRILQRVDYKIDATNMQMHAERKQGALSDAMEKTSTRDAIIAVQNALVKYIREEGPNLPLTRGAGALLFITQEFADDVHPDTMKFLTRNLTDLRDGTRYHAEIGEIRHVRPVFEP